MKSETTSLAVSLELPFLLVDVQRGGPSTGLPTKTEAADLNIAMYGRHGEAPLPIVAAYSPANCFDAAIEACRIALKYRTSLSSNGRDCFLRPVSPSYQTGRIRSTIASGDEGISGYRKANCGTKSSGDWGIGVPDMISLPTGR